MLLRSKPVRLVFAFVVTAAVFATGAAAPEWTTLEDFGPDPNEWRMVNRGYALAPVRDLRWTKRPLWRFFPQFSKRLISDPAAALPFYHFDMFMLMMLLAIAGLSGTSTYLLTEPRGPLGGKVLK